MELCEVCKSCEAQVVLREQPADTRLPLCWDCYEKCGEVNRKYKDRGKWLGAP